MRDLINIICESISPYPAILRNGSEIAAYIASLSPQYVDEEMIEEYVGRSTEGVLREIPIAGVREGNPDGNIRSAAKEKRYLKKSLETMPPIVIDSENEIIDGNHRYRVARARGAETIWAYVLD